MKTHGIIYYESNNITREIIKDVISINVTDNLSRLDDLSISLSDPTRKWMDKWMPLKGDKIRVEFKGVNWEEDKKESTISFGPFSIDGLTHGGSPQTVSINGISLGLNNSLKDEKKNKAWENIDLKSLALEICKTGEIDLYFESDYIPRYQRIEQNEESDLALLRRLCEKECLEIKTELDKIIIFDERKYEKGESLLEIKHNNSLNYSITNDDIGSYDICLVTYFDSKLKKNIVGEFKAPIREGYKENTLRTLRVTDSEALEGTTEEQKINELNRRAQNHLRQINKEAVKISINNLKGDFDIWAGGIITLSDFGNYSGRYLIKGINRSLSSKFSMDLELQKEVGY